MASNCPAQAVPAQAVPAQAAPDTKDANSLNQPEQVKTIFSFKHEIGLNR